MKKLMKFFGIVAVAAMSLTACDNNINEQLDANTETVTVEIYAQTPTRTTFGDKVDGVYTSTWTGNETVLFSLNEDVDITSAKTAAGETGLFNVTFASTTKTSGKIYAFSPKGVYNSSSVASCKGGFTSTKLYSSYKNAYLVIPATQKPTDKSVDEAAQPLLAAYSYSDGVPASAALEFEHVLAYGKMAIEDFAGNGIKTIELEFPTAVAGTGCYCYYEAKGNFGFAGIDKANINTITIDGSQVGSGTYWFGIAPTGTLSGSIILTITDNDGLIYKKELQTANKLAFNRGEVSSFTVSMDGVSKTLATPSNVKAEVDGLDVTVTWNAVQDATSYVVTCGDQTATVTTNSADFTMDEYTTDYDITVVATAEGYNDSFAATATVRTGNDPSSAVQEVTATIKFDNKSKRTVFTTSQQVWVENGITVTNDKASSTSNVGDYFNPARFYKSSKITIAVSGDIKSIVFDCNSSSYATVLKSSIATSTGTITVSSDKVTVIPSSTASSFVIANLSGGQVRMDSITVTYDKKN